MKILFICTHNRCRSILAEAVINHIGQPYIQAVSAGSSPQGEVHPLSLQYLSAHGIATEGLQSKSWHDFEYFRPDAVITLCDSAAKEACPVWFCHGVQAHWGLDDPSKLVSKRDQDTAFNNTIDILQRRANALLDLVTVSAENGVNSTKLHAILEQIAVDIN